MIYDDILTHFEQGHRGLLKKINDPIAHSGAQGIMQAIRSSEKIFFDETTMRMLDDRMAHYHETLQEIASYYSSKEELQQSLREINDRISLKYQGAMIAFQQPIAIEGGSIEVMMNFLPANFVDTGSKIMSLYLISTTHDILYRMQSIPMQGWMYDPSHLYFCPQKKCHLTEDRASMMVCPSCQHILDEWTKRFSLSALIAGQYLAKKSYEEKQHTYIQRIPRKENPKKEKRVASTYTYKVINANELIIPVLPYHGEEEEAPIVRRKQEGDSWLTVALAENNVIYKTVQTREFQRTYRSERYVNVRGTTVKFPNGIQREQPVRKDRLGTTVSKVIAPEYREK